MSRRALLGATAVAAPLGLSERPARIKAEIRNRHPYPRHRDDPHLVSLRRRVLELLGLEAA